MTAYNSTLKNKVLIPTFNTLEILEVSEIISVCAFENYCKLQLTDNRHYTSTQAFGKLVEQLESFGFYKCHKSFLVNTAHILRYHKSGEVELSNKSKIPVARRRKDEFLEILSYYTNTGLSDARSNL